MKIAKILGLLVVIAGCYFAGLYGGPAARGLYARLFPEPPYVVGHYEALYAEAGKPVVLFSTSTCPFCKKTRELLSARKIPYTDYVIDKSSSAERRFKELGGKAVPLLFVGNRRIVGFNEQVIEDSVASQLRAAAPTGGAPRF